MQRSSAYLLVFHGSSDRRPQAAATALAQLFTQRIQYATTDLPFTRSGNLSFAYDPSPADSVPPSQVAGTGLAVAQEKLPHVGVASLECHPLPLHEQINQFATSLLLSEHNLTRIVILPLFLLPGVHVKEDIPAAVAQAQQALGQRVKFEIMPHLGCHPGFGRLVTERMAGCPAEVWILLSHGSRRPGANQVVEALAERLGAVTAYWSVSPSLETRIQELVELGLKRIAIFPYFLFSGGTTDAIAALVHRLAQQFPGLNLHFTPALDINPELADLVVDLAEGRVGEF